MELGTAVGVLSRAVPSITESQIRQLIERGAIWAWDFSASRRRGRKPFLRLLSRSVAAMDYPNLSRLLADPYHIPAPNPPTPREAVAAPWTPTWIKSSPPSSPTPPPTTNHQPHNQK